MFTVCPKCTLTLAVTANDLRVGQGYVRCGRCSNVFNALLKLSEAPAEGAGTELPELAQADPASTSQIHRAITAAALDSGAPAAGSAAAQAPSRPAPRPPGPAPTPRAPAASAAISPRPAAPPASAKPPATATRAAPTTAAAPQPPVAARAAAAGPVNAPRESVPAPPAAARAVSGDAAAGPLRRRSTDALPESHVAPSAPLPQPLKNPSPPTPPRGSPMPPHGMPPQATPSSAAPAATSSASAAAAPSMSAARQSSAPVSAAVAPAPPTPPGAARTPIRPSAAAHAPEGTASKAPEGDHDAIDQFELVLQTLGLNADGDEPLLRGPDDNLEPTQTVENIVLEGDEVRQSEARVPDKPLDELDLFTRRLGIATNATPPAEPLTNAQGSPGATRPMVGRMAARRARLAGRRSTDAAVSGDGTLAAARASGRDPGVPDSDALEAEAPEDLPAAAGSPDLDIPALRAAAPMQQRLWLGGSVALVVLLLVQLVNHWRDALAASPTWGHPVTGLYATLGVPLQPRWDLSAYEVRQQGAESEGGPHAAIRVRFSLANHATRAQPVPLLRLTLLDRYGRRVAERDLTPADYWPKGRSVQNFLAADERVDTEVQVRDPSADSASFELDVCLPEGRSGVHCAGDAAAAEAAGVPP